MRNSMLTLACLAAGLSMAPAAAQTPTQAWPSRTITLVVAYAPGGTGDVVARLVASRLGPALGQTMVVENRPGASGAIGTQFVIRAPADGHTILLGQTAEIAINQNLTKTPIYDPGRDLEPVALAADAPLALVVPPNAPYATLDALLATARATPNGLTFASAGVGTPGHFAGEFLRLKTKANLLHVPYKGDALKDVLAGHVGMFFSGYPAALPLIRSGSIKVLAVSSAQRGAGIPEVPTVAELTGIKEFDLTVWQGFFVPRGTPPTVVARLNTEINAILEQPDIRQRLSEAGAYVRPMSGDAFAAFVRAQSDKYKRIAADTGIGVE